MASELTEWRPFPDFAELRHRLDQVFRDLSDGGQRGWSPSVDLVRRDDALVLRADIPGLKPEEVKIEIEDDVLTISGEHREEKEEKQEDYVRRERRFGSFSRSMAMPKGVEPDEIKATTEDGVLEVTIPMPKAAEKKKVEIEPKEAG